MILLFCMVEALFFKIIEPVEPLDKYNTVPKVALVVGAVIPLNVDVTFVLGSIVMKDLSCLSKGS